MHHCWRSENNHFTAFVYIWTQFAKQYRDKQLFLFRWHKLFSRMDGLWEHSVVLFVLISFMVHAFFQLVPYVVCNVFVSVRINSCWCFKIQNVKMLNFHEAGAKGYGRSLSLEIRQFASWAFFSDVFILYFV